jgi:signal transduction histidine kinase
VQTRSVPPASAESAGAEAQAERIASLVFIAGRGGQLVFSALMLASDRRRYEQPMLQVAALAGMIAESAWLSRRLIRAGKYDDRLGVWVDCASAAAAVLVSRQGLGANGAAPWAKNVAIGAAIGAASTRRTVDNAGTVGVLCAAAVATGVRARGRDLHVAGLALAVNDAVSWAGTHLASRSYLNAHRRYARLRDEADELATERAAAAASEAERGRQQERLHQLTMGVLNQLADSPDLGSATDAARIEAARLRYALRSGGHLPQGLDRALANLAQAAWSTGIRVDLVTAELGPVPGSEATQALATAAERALKAAREFGSADRAVVRAVSTKGSITVSVRDHGLGFEPGAGSDYEARLRTIADLLEPWAGSTTMSSEPGNGVRVTMTLSVGACDADDPPDGLPEDPVRNRAAGNHIDPGGDNHVNTGLLGSYVSGTQYEVGRAGIEDLDAGLPRDPLQTGPQQRQPGGYPGRRGSIHQASVPASRPFRVGRNTQFDELPAAHARAADRTLLTALLSWRATGLITGTAALVGGRTRYRSRSVAATQLALAVGESAWYARRVLRRDRWSDPTASAVDAVTGTAIVLLGHANLDRADRPTWINWPPWTFAANVICGQAMSVPPAARAAAGAAAVVGANMAQRGLASDTVADSVALTAFFLVARFFAAQMRGSAVRLEQARERALTQGRRLAEAHERSSQLRLLHDHALQALETIASGQFTDLGLIRSQARAEAARLGSELARTAADSCRLRERLKVIIAGHDDLLIRFDCPELPPFTEAVVLACCGATDEALTNVAKHARTSRASVAARHADGNLTVTIADNGIGFDQSLTRAGFGVRESIELRMRDAGGFAVIYSVPGAGTRITLTWPA